MSQNFRIISSRLPPAAITRKQRYGVVIKAEQDETGNFQISDIVKIGNPNITNFYGAFKSINVDYEKVVFEQTRQHFTGVHCEPLLVATQTFKGSNLLFAVNARLSKGSAKSSRFSLEHTSRFMAK